MQQCMNNYYWLKPSLNCMISILCQQKYKLSNLNHIKSKHYLINTMYQYMNNYCQSKSCQNCMINNLCLLCYMLNNWHHIKNKHYLINIFQLCMNNYCQPKPSQNCRIGILCQQKYMLSNWHHIKNKHDQRYIILRCSLYNMYLYLCMLDNQKSIINTIYNIYLKISKSKYLIISKLKIKRS